MIVNKKCAECGKDFEYDEKPGYPRKYCFSCSDAKKKSFADRQKPEEKVEVVKPGEVKTPQEMKAPTGEFQSLVYNKTLCANSYEVGSAGNRFKLYFENVEELQAKLKELKDAGLMLDEEKEFS